MFNIARLVVGLSLEGPVPVFEFRPVVVRRFEFLRPSVLHPQFFKEGNHLHVFALPQLPVKERHRERPVRGEVLRHDAQRRLRPQRIAYPCERLPACGNVVREDEVADNESPLYEAVVSRDGNAPDLAVHLDHRIARMPGVAVHLRVFPPHRVIPVFQVRQIDVDDAVEETQDLHGIVGIGVVDERDAEPGAGGRFERHDDLGDEVRGGDESDRVTPLLLELNHHTGEPPDRCFVLNFELMVLADEVVLAVDAPEIAVPEEDVPDAVRSHKGGFFTEMGRVRGNDRKLPRVTARDLPLQPVVAAIVRADRARAEHGAERGRAAAEFACPVEGDIGRNERHRKKYSKVST